MSDRRSIARANMLDRVVGYINPEAGMRRVAARQVMDAMSASAGRYTAGGSRRSMHGWRPRITSADGALMPDLEDIQGRARDLERNQPLATGAINTITGSVIGSGLMPRPQLDRNFLGLSEEQADQVSTDIRRVWIRWASSPDASLSREHTFVELQEIAFRECLVAGDVFALPRRKDRPGAAYLLSCQLVEAERVHNPRGQIDGLKLANGNRLTGGIEMDDDGAPVRYWVRDRYASEMTRADRVPGPVRHMDGWSMVPAFNAAGRRVVHHIVERRRYEQTRGIPILAPVIEQLRQLADYTDAELRAAVVSALLTVFVTTATGSPKIGNTPPTSGAGGDAAGGSDDIRLGTGAVVGLAPGENVTTVTPGRPNEKFDPFVQAILRQIGVALELPFEVLILHFTSSYTAARAALLQAWRMYRRRRAWFASRFCQPFYDAVLEEAVLRGHLVLPGFLESPDIAAAYCRAAWSGPTPGQLDPMKETQAADLRVKSRFSSRTRETAEMTGEWWPDVYAEIEAEDRLIGPAAAAPGPAADNDGTDDGDADEGDDGGDRDDSGDDRDAEPRPDPAGDRE